MIFDVLFYKIINLFIGSGKSLYAIENIPNFVHESLYSGYPTVNPVLYSVFYIWNGSTYYVSHNNISLFNPNDYIFSHIKINIVNPETQTHHVNSLFINSTHKYVIHFEPLIKVKIDVSNISNIIPDDYIWYCMQDLGFNVKDRFSGICDALCQTYCFLAFETLIFSDIENVMELSSLFKNKLNRKEIKKFLKTIDALLSQLGYNFQRNFSVKSFLYYDSNFVNDEDNAFLSFS